jgi:hypothetical protein
VVARPMSERRYVTITLVARDSFGMHHVVEGDTDREEALDAIFLGRGVVRFRSTWRSSEPASAWWRIVDDDGELIRETDKVLVLEGSVVELHLDSR